MNIIKHIEMFSYETSYRTGIIFPFPITHNPFMKENECRDFLLWEWLVRAVRPAVLPQYFLYQWIFKSPAEFSLG